MGAVSPNSKQHTSQPSKTGPKASGTWQATATFHWLVGGHPGVEDDGSCCVLQVMGGGWGCGVERKGEVGGGE